MKKKYIISVATIGLALSATAIAGLWGWHVSEKQNEQLKSDLQNLIHQEKRSAVMRSVSAQMEVIALQQKDIYEEQREEALQQTRVANEMREQSEKERKKAIIAQEVALISERKALDAYDLAETQRKIAEQQRLQAESSKRRADTLSYIALSRSLGSLSISQYRAGNHDLANLLCCAAYIYTSRYKGDIYYPILYQALTMCSQSINGWTRHDETLKDIEFIPKSDNKLVTVSSYGEIMQHVRSEKQLNTKILFKDSKYDFRNVFVNPRNNNIYAVSFTGSLIILNSNGHRDIPLYGLVHPFSLEPMQDDNFLLIVGENGIVKLDLRTNKIVDTKQLDYKITLCCRYDYAPTLFDNMGKMYIVRDVDRITPKKVPILGKVTAFASSKTSGYEAYGMDNGNINIIDKHGKIQRLIGHHSRISRLKLNNTKLYSSSYDGTINLWIISNQKIEPMTLLETDNWIAYFTFDPSKNYIWSGCQNGTLSEALISVKRMYEKVHQKLVRNFTVEEWNYYIGANIPYESIMASRGKEVNL